MSCFLHNRRYFSHFLSFAAMSLNFALCEKGPQLHLIKPYQMMRGSARFGVNK